MKRSYFVICTFFLVLLLLPNALVAEEAVTQTTDTDFLSLVLKGGWLMIPIGLASIFAFAVTVERFMSFKKEKALTITLVDDLKNVYQNSKEDKEKGLEFCDKNPSAMSTVLRNGITQLPQRADNLEKVMEESGAREVHKMKRSIRSLSVIATVAPLMGLLGTVYGMISAFQATTNMSGGSKSAVLAEGIYEALVTTAAGLTLAIPVLIIFQLLNGHVDSITDVIDSKANEFIEHITDIQDKTGVEV